MQWVGTLVSILANRSARDCGCRRATRACRRPPRTDPAAPRPLRGARCWWPELHRGRPERGGHRASRVRGNHVARRVANGDDCDRDARDAALGAAPADEPVGCGAKRSVAQSLAVRPDARGQGWARVLFDLLRGHAHESGATLLELDTAVPAMHLRSPYERWGFREREVIHWPGKTHDSVVMSRDLVAPDVLRAGRRRAIRRRDTA